MVARMGSQLQITNIEVFDKGFYTCKVTNRRETIESQGVLDVRRDIGKGSITSFLSFGTAEEVTEGGENWHNDKLIMVCINEHRS